MQKTLISFQDFSSSSFKTLKNSFYFETNLLNLVAEIFIVIVKSKKKGNLFLSFFDNVWFELKRLTFSSTLLEITKTSSQRFLAHSEKTVLKKL